MILGIDPGTTVGWAILDFDGNIVSIGSERGLEQGSLIAKVISKGKVLIVGCDKAKLPAFVQETARKLGAIAVGPSQDLGVREKRELTGSFSFTNAHEMDALAGAIFGRKKIAGLVQRIRSFLSRENKLHLFSEVIELVLKDRISIKHAVEFLSPKDELFAKKESVAQNKPDKSFADYERITGNLQGRMLCWNRALKNCLFLEIV